MATGTQGTHEVVIVSIARTPVGSFQGALAGISAPKLGTIAIQGALSRAGIKPNQVSEVIMGNVLTAGEGQAPARQAAIGAGIPTSVPALTINKVCGSGMKAVMLGAQSIMLGDSEVVVAGGMENMSQSPYLVPNARAGFRMGNQQFVDSMINDGLWDPYNNQHMGNCGELCAKERNFTRQAQDAFSIESFRRAQEAQKSGKLADEIVPVEIQGRKGDVTLFSADEGPAKVQFDKIPTLKPAFDKQGTITAANASTLNDGAAALVLMSADKARELGLKPLAKLVSYGSNAQDPAWFTTAPAEAMRRAMKKAGWESKDVDLWEVNEAFAVVAMAAEQDLGIPHERLNVRGGGISIGHPIGASGARIIVTLISALKEKNMKRGVAGICIGGGEATAVCVECL
ncbi:MAG: acetyl-CoA C-acetyltransferase [Oligoflexia bacterium]|nr:acetyl-CoA C-acetyltransferase [Oligoflexia bacterium]